ncbi:MAG: MvaI/BcnI family restriction endonuclease [Ktedonobacteraceae bacterium]
MKTFTKESLIAELKAISEGGWVKSCREPGNHGAVGNTLEQLLGIPENNLPLPNAAEWELKGQRRKPPTKTSRINNSMRASSLLTLFHMEPSPRAFKFVPNIFLPKYGWTLNHSTNELSFRLTIGASDTGGRGFRVVIDDIERKVLISFNARLVDSRHTKWLETVEERGGLGELDPQPYWGFDDLEHKAGIKLKNTFYVLADTKKQDGAEYFNYNGVFMLQTFSMAKFLELLRRDLIKVDFDARSGFGRVGHNHGTKFRMQPSLLTSLYETVKTIVDKPLDYSERAKYIDLTNIRSTEVIEEAASKGPIITPLPPID